MVIIYRRGLGSANLKIVCTKNLTPPPSEFAHYVFAPLGSSALKYCPPLTHRCEYTVFTICRHVVSFDDRHLVQTTDLEKSSKIKKKVSKSDI